MSKVYVPCKTCGTLFAPCVACSNKAGMAYRAVACSPECGREYFRRIAISRGELVEESISEESEGGEPSPIESIPETSVEEVKEEVKVDTEEKAIEIELAVVEEDKPHRFAKKLRKASNKSEE